MLRWGDFYVLLGHSYIQLQHDTTCLQLFLLTALPSSYSRTGNHNCLSFLAISNNTRGDLCSCGPLLLTGQHHISFLIRCSWLPEHPTTFEGAIIHVFPSLSYQMNAKWTHVFDWVLVDHHTTTSNNHCFFLLLLKEVRFL